MHVLIIEDDLLIALDVQACVEKMGASSTEMASSEDHAVRSAQRRRPDLIASDVRLAQGSGPSAVKRIQEDHGPIPVIYITATPETTNLVQAGSYVLTKPFQWSALEAAGRALGLAASGEARHNPPSVACNQTRDFRPIIRQLAEKRICN